MLSLRQSEYSLLDSIKTVDAIEELYKCSSCKKLLKRPFQAVECGHRFCWNCLSAIKKDMNGKRRCPVDQDVVTDTFEDKSALREILELKCHCLNHEQGCQWTGVISLVFQHIKECAFTLVPCVFDVRGCSETVPRKDLDSHVALCVFKLADCKFCEAPMSQIELEDHYKVCPYYPRTCDMCGQVGLTASTLEQHQMLDCPQAMTCCPIYVVGCAFLGTSKEVQDHIFLSAPKHSQLVGKSLNSSADKSALLDDLSALLKSRVLDLENVHDSVAHEQKKMRSEIEIEKVTDQRSRMEIDSAAALLLARENDLAERLNMTSSGTLIGLANVSDVKRQFNEINSILEEAEKVSTTLNKKKGPRKTYDEDYKRRMNKMEEELAHRSTKRLFDAEVACRLLESRWINGKAIWRVDSFSARFESAVRGTTKEFYSPPLLTKLYGYKMCFSLLLNGDTTVRGGQRGCISFRLRLMRSEFDACLRFPFSREITITLIDQSDSADKQNIVHVIYPEENFDAYRRPKEQMNSAVCIPQFCTHRDLYSRSYVKDDVLFVKVEIERFGQEGY